MSEHQSGIDEAIRRLGDLSKQVEVAQVAHHPEHDRVYEVHPNYHSLASVYREAIEQASNGKGYERHASDEPWESQQIFEIARRIGNVGPAAGPLFQAVKKIYELKRLRSREARERETLGALNYLAAAFDMIGEMP